MSEDRFVTLRKLLSLWPQEIIWEQLCSLLRGWPESAERDTAIAYADAHLDAWPESMRVAQVLLDWPTFPYGEPSPVWRLARTLHSAEVSESICGDMATWQGLVDSPHLSHLTALDWFYSASGSEDNVENILLTHAISCFIGVRTLILSCDHAPLWAHDFFPSVRNLQRLVISGAGVPSTIELIRDMPCAAQVTSLSLIVPTPGRDEPPVGAAFGAELLAYVKAFEACESLALIGLPWTDEVVKAIGDVLVTLPIKRLSLSLSPQGWMNEEASREAVEVLLRGLPIQQLEALTLKRFQPGLAVVDGLLAHNGCERLRELALHDCGIDVEAARALSSWAPLAQLTSLSLDKNPIHNRGLQSILERAYPLLKRLSLRQCKIRLPGARVLAHSPHLPALQSLDLEDNDVRSVGARVLASSAQLIGLKELILTDNSVYWTGYKALALSEGLAGLEALDLYSYSGYFEGESLFNLSHFDLPPGLWKLELSSAWDREIKPEQMEAFAKLQTQRRLLEVKLSHQGLPIGSLKQLIKAQHLEEMMRLELGYCQIDAAGVAVLAKARHFQGLRSLELNGNSIGDKGALALSKAPWLRQLWVLHLAYCEIGDEGARGLVSSGALTEIREFSLQGSTLSLETALFLIKSPQLPHVASLTVGFERFKGDEKLALYDAARLHKPWLRLTV